MAAVDWYRPNPEASVQLQRLQSVLARFGGSVLGARQLMAGQPVTSAADRRAIGDMMSRLMFTWGELVQVLAPEENAHDAQY
jgi:hypothetical protein